MASEKVDVTIRIDPSESGRLDDIVQDLKARGLDQVESHKRFMIVNGSIDADALAALQEVRGVASVRRDRTYKPQTR
jgi:hypothetical protein